MLTQDEFTKTVLRAIEMYYDGLYTVQDLQMSLISLTEELKGNDGFLTEQTDC